jgi:hypothetical protein
MEGYGAPELAAQGGHSEKAGGDRGIAVSSCLRGRPRTGTADRPGASAAAPPGPVRAAVRARHYSRRTEQAYVHWIRRYIGYDIRTVQELLGHRDVSTTSGC